MNGANNKLNINTIFCEKYDENTDSYTRAFDSINLSNNNSISNFSIVHFVSLLGTDKHRIVSIFAKKGEGKIESLIDVFDFYIPPQDGNMGILNSLDTKENEINRKTIIREINMNKLEGSGEYILFVFTQSVKEGQSKEIKLQDMELETKAILTVFE